MAIQKGDPINALELVDYLGNKSQERLFSQHIHRTDWFNSLHKAANLDVWIRGDAAIYDVDYYIPATTYDKDDLVREGSQVYRSLVGTNTGNLPSTNPDFWDYIASLHVSDDDSEVKNTPVGSWMGRSNNGTQVINQAASVLFNHVPFVGGATYAIGDVVYASAAPSGYYVSLKAGVTSATITDTEFWSPLILDRNSSGTQWANFYMETEAEFWSSTLENFVINRVIWDGTGSRIYIPVYKSIADINVNDEVKRFYFLLEPGFYAIRARQTAPLFAHNWTTYKARRSDNTFVTDDTVRISLPDHSGLEPKFTILAQATLASKGLFSSPNYRGGNHPDYLGD